MRYARLMRSFPIVSLNFALEWDLSWHIVKYKTIYDQFGEDTLREGVRDEKGSKLKSCEK